MILPKGAQRIIELLEKGGFEAYAVGGCVRDALMGLAPKDYDICTSAAPEEMSRVFAGQHVIETGLKHGTLTIVMDGTPYEVTAYRVDGDYADHRHPDGVTFVRDLRADLSRRDFTVNAMAYHPASGLVDLFGGREDIKNRRIRCVGQAMRRFNEDALRILRALRFAAVCGFAIESDTAAAVHAMKDSLRHVAKERITAECGKMICGQAAEEVLTQFKDVLDVILPCRTSITGIGSIKPEVPLRLAYLLRDEGETERALGHLRLDNETAAAVTELVRNCERERPQGGTEVKLLLRDLGLIRTEQLYHWKGWDDRELRTVLQQGSCWNLKQLAVNGRDLVEIGYPAGAAIGRALNAALEKVIRGEIPNEKSALLAELRR